ncbi:MAG: hypothetical protein J6Y49_01915, partial [Alphaproteobacteria bacterium]|nr:hypothetical protein [Alphaproteobacteria bacterium]
PTNCYSGYLTKTASSATAWGTATNNLTAKGGYKVSGSGNSATCSACGNGYYSADGNDTTCDACPDATSTNWTVATTSTTATSYSACYETRNATNISSYCSAGVLKKTASSATAWGTASASTAFQAKAGSYVSGSGDSLSCAQCAIGSYTASAGTQTSCEVCGSGTTTSAAGQTSCNATCSNNNDYDNAWATPSWNNNSPTGLCKITNCKSGSYYTSTNSGNTNTCTACADGSFMASNAHTTTACTLCSSLTGVSPSGGTYSTGGSTGSTANTACKYVAPNKTITGCKTVTSQSVTYSGTAWPASTYGVTASKGYVIANNNSSTATCTACTGATYQATDGSTATTCSACPNQTSGWTRGTGTAWTAVTSCYETRTPADCASGTIKHNATNSTTWGSDSVTTALTATANHYVSGTTCPTCSSGTNSNYTLSAAGTTSVNDCYLNTTATKYVAEAGAGEVTCLKGGYCPGGTSVYYGGTSTSSHPTTGGRTTCPANSFCVGGVSAATACSTLGGNLYTNSASGSDENSDCYITTTAGKYLAASTDTAQTQCPGANYCPSVTLYYPNVNTATPCPTADASTARTTYPDDFYNPTRNNISNQTWTKGITNIEGCMANYSFSNARGNFTTESTPYSSTSGKYDRTAGNKYYTKFNAGYYGVTKYSATYCNTGTNNMLYKDAQPCPAGSYCPGITTLPKCNTGTYADTLGIDACAAGSYSAGSASSCTVCPAGRTTSGEGTVFNTNANTTCSVTCSAIANLSTWTTPTWSKTYTAPLYSDTVTGTCTVDACVAGAYKSGNTCPVCATDKWSDAGATSCSNCSTTNGYHNSGDTAAAHAGSSSCIASCAAKTAVTTENAACATLGTGYWAAAHTVAYGSTSVVNTDYAQCPAGYRDGAVASAQSGCTMSVTGGKYVATQNASSATNCANWTWKGAHTVTYGNTSTCESCPTLDSGWAKKNSTGTGWTAVTQCVETHTPANCASGTTKKVATNSTTWGSEVFDTTLSSNAGYYAGTSAISCTICPAGSYCPAGATAAIACVTGSYTSTTGKSACTACQDGATTSGTGKTSCDATCANATDSEDENAIYSWSEATWNSNNTMSDLCKAATCYRDHYIDGNDCERCDSFANGFYPLSPSGTSSGQSACYLRKSDIPGMYIAEAYATVGTPCAAGTYSDGEAVIHYGETSTCKNCADNTYATAGSAACTPCAQNYTTPNGSAKDSESACRIYCAGGSYIAAARDTTCTDVGAGYWAAGAYVAQGSTGTRTQCTTGLTTVGRGTGADEAGDCGRKLHAGNSVVYLRSNKVTTPSLHVKIGGTTFYGNMSTQTIGSMRVKRNGQTYSVYDDITEEEGGASGGGSGITINPSTQATTIVPSTYASANGETTWSAVVGETELEGIAACSATTAAHAELSTSSFTPENAGTGCWCKLTSPATGTKWIYATANSLCSTKCAFYCANNMKGTAAKNINYRTNIYTAAGISTE